MPVLHAPKMRPIKAGAALNKEGELLAEHGGTNDRFSSTKWQRWHAHRPVHADGQSGKCDLGNKNIDAKTLIPWVKQIAQRIHRPLPANVLLNDLIQDGMIGLVMALNEYQEEVGIPFYIFAKNRIRWTIMDGLRAADWADSHVRGRANRVSKVSDKLQALLHRKPSNQEIADALEMRAKDISKILGDVYGYSFVQIDDCVEGGAQDIPDSSMEPSCIAERRESYLRALKGLEILPKSERKAFILRNLCDLNGQQAATEMGLTESRVSQLNKTAKEKLASYV